MIPARSHSPRPSPASGPTRSVVYISYDGLEDPLGRSQVLPYVLGLAARGHSMELLTFEKPGVGLCFRRPLAPAVRWTALRYHRSPSVPATGFDMLHGLATLARICWQSAADLVHTRSYVAAALALPWAASREVPLLFDTRGFLFDERADAGAWSRSGLLFATAKRVERSLFRRADAITVLSHDMQAYLRREYASRQEISAPIRVIPTCADLDLFSAEGPRDQSLAPRLEGARVLTYLGAFGPSYLAEEMARFYLAWRHVVGRARFLVVSRDDPAVIGRVLSKAGVADELVPVPASHDKVPELIRWADAAVLFFPAVFSKRGSAPTKLGELLGCGIPLATTSIGDAEALFADHQAGVIVRSFDAAALHGAAGELAGRAARPSARRAARALAEAWFSLDSGLSAYDALYREIRTPGELRPALPDAGWPRSNLG